jgi:signal transduction histidine kinase
VSIVAVVARRSGAEALVDGKGISSPSHTGVGLTSMRERAAELGGTCTVEPRPDGADQRERANDPPIWPQRPRTRIAA